MIKKPELGLVGRQPALHGSTASMHLLSKRSIAFNMTAKEREIMKRLEVKDLKPGDRMRWENDILEVQKIETFKHDVIRINFLNVTHFYVDHMCLQENVKVTTI